MALMSICTLYVKNVYMATRDGRPAPHCGEGEVPRPAPSRKMIKTAGKLRGKIKARISNFSNRGNQYDGTIIQH